jgi:hypothetical protein
MGNFCSRQQDPKGFLLLNGVLVQPITTLPGGEIPRCSICHEWYPSEENRTQAIKPARTSSTLARTFSKHSRTETAPGPNPPVPGISLFVCTPIVRISACGHIFGEPCLKKWFERKDTCPVCRCKLKAVEPQTTRDSFDSLDSESSIESLNRPPTPSLFERRREVERNQAPPRSTHERLVEVERSLAEADALLENLRVDVRRVRVVGDLRVGVDEEGREGSHFVGI